VLLVRKDLFIYGIPTLVAGILLRVKIQDSQPRQNPSLAMVCELPRAAGLGLLSYVMALRRFCFNILCITFGPAFAFSNFDVVGCLGFAFDVFCVTGLSLLASQNLMVLNC